MFRNSVGLLVCCVLGSVLAAPHPVPEYFSREEWKARTLVNPPTPLAVDIPEFVVIHHSATRTCTNNAACKKLVKSFQNYHIDHNKWNDIGYNFVIGEDGAIYEGRGWGITGAHAPGFNNRSIGICITGDFTDKLPNKAALAAMDDLILYGVANKHIDALYKLIGHRQASRTECPGTEFFDFLKTSNHWFPNPKDAKELF